MAVLDSGCTKTVCGEKWLTQWEREDSEKIKATKKAEIPARIVGHCTSIKAEVLSKDIPLLLSKKAMQDANDAKVHIDFINDKTKTFGSDLDVICRKSGHYCIPILSFKHIDHENKIEVLLSTNDMNSKKEKLNFSKKLHRQFGHAT